MSAVMELVDKLTGRAKQRERDRVQTYRDLVRKVVRGEKVDPDNAESLLDGAGKSPADLQADVAKAHLRIQLKASLAELPGIDGKIADLERQLAAAEEAFLAAQRERQSVRAALVPQLTALTNRRSQTALYIDELAATTDNPEVTERNRALGAESAGLYEREREIKEQLKTSKANTVGWSLYDAKRTAAEAQARVDKLTKSGVTGTLLDTAQTDRKTAEERLTALQNGPIRNLESQLELIANRRKQIDEESRRLFIEACEV
jgi:hypothetical protein